MPRVATHSDGEESSESKNKAPLDENGAQDEEEGEGEEYEIEEVLDAKRGVFPDGRMGYYVKWKGYGPADNSWVDELDAINAKDVVEEFWKKNPQKKRAVDRKSLDKKMLEKGRKSIVADDSSDAVEVKPKKRGRKSAVRKSSSNEDMDVDQPVPRVAKKARKDQNITATQSETPDALDEEEKTIGNMKNYMHLTNWEGVVSSVDTVERSEDDVLTVYFTLNTGECVMEKSDICNSRFPQKLLKFYESNLRWRSADEN